MSQPSQVFPPWLAPSAVVITDAGGVPVTTSTTIVYIPPTYFGPSIPLGTLFSFGGTSEPPTIILPSPTPQTITTTAGPSVTTTATPSTTTILTTTATPTTSLSISSSSSSSSSVTVSTTSATSTSIITTSSAASLSSTTSAILSSSTFSPSTSITSSTASSSSTASVGASHLSKGQLVGVIVASILGLITLFVAVLFAWLCLKQRRRREFSTLRPIDDDYFVVPSGVRLPGEGSPRHSGEEGDSFLQQRSAPESSAAAARRSAMTQVPGQAAFRDSLPPLPVPILAPTSSDDSFHSTGSNGSAPVERTASQRIPRVPPPPVAITGSHSSDSTNSTNSNASGFGVLIDRPSLGYLPSMPAHPEEGGRPLSAADMARIGHESVLPDDADQYGDEEYTGPYAYSKDPQVPPRLVDPTAASTPLLGGVPPFATPPRNLSNKSSLAGDPEEAATLLTARRVKVEDLGPRSISESSAGPSHKVSNGLLGALGLGSLANLGRLSWFKNLDSPRQSIATPRYSADPLSEKDLETGRSMLSPDSRQVDSFGNRPRGGLVGVLPDGSRPKSNVSARSGASAGTLYHDAQSSLPTTPLLAPLPRALTPAEQPLPPTEHAWFSSPLSSPPAYSDHPLASSSPPPTIGSPDNTSADILDMPAPTALGHFSSISSLKEMTTGSSLGFKPTPFPPPGLDTIRPIGWSDTATDVTASMGSFAALSGGMGMEHSNAVSVDVLEEEPPDAEQGWRTISSAGGGGISDPDRRGTFGMFVHSPGYMSEQGSLHSMRSHFSPSMRSTGSSPASRREIVGSVSSNSSRPSAHSVARSIGSGVSVAHSLLRTGSISSDERKRHGPGHLPCSPALSAFGHGQSRTSSSGGHQQSPLSPVIGSPPSAHMSPAKSNTIRSIGSVGSTTAMDTSFGTMDTVRPGVDGGLGLQTERSMSPVSAAFSATSAPWAGGLDRDWQPAA